jgi:hypothetical protein
MNPGNSTTIAFLLVSDHYCSQSVSCHHAIIKPFFSRHCISIIEDFGFFCLNFVRVLHVSCLYLHITSFVLAVESLLIQPIRYIYVLVRSFVASAWKSATIRGAICGELERSMFAEAEIQLKESSNQKWNWNNLSALFSSSFVVNAGNQIYTRTHQTLMSAVSRDA